MWRRRTTRRARTRTRLGAAQFPGRNYLRHERDSSIDLLEANQIESDSAALNFRTRKQDRTPLIIFAYLLAWNFVKMWIDFYKSFIVTEEEHPLLNLDGPWIIGFGTRIGFGSTC